MAVRLLNSSEPLATSIAKKDMPKESGFVAPGVSAGLIQ